MKQRSKVLCGCWYCAPGREKKAILKRKIADREMREAVNSANRKEEK